MAKEFVSLVVNRYKNYRGIFENHKNAEDLAPNSDDITKALFLFYVIQLDYATKSQRLYDGAKSLFNEISKFYTPDFILNLVDDELRTYIANYLKPRYINEAILRYKANSKKLKSEYESNPTLIFTYSESAKEALKKDA